MNWLIRVFSAGGIDREDFENLKPVLEGQNKDNLLFMSFFGTFSFFLALLSSFLLPQWEPLRIPFSCMTVICALFFYRGGDFHHIKLLSKISCTFLSYCFTTILLAFFLVFHIQGYFSNGCTSFCVCLAVCSVLIADRPTHNTLYILAVSIGYCLTAGRFCSPSEAAAHSLAVLISGGITILVATRVRCIKMQDLTLRAKTEHDRDTDALTGLLTKAAFERQLEKYLNSVGHCGGAMIMMDIDRFKQINDTFGHAAGDAVLAKVGECIRKTFRQNDILGRFGGDEFVLFLPRLNDRGILEARAWMLIEMLTREVYIPGQSIRVSCSIGIALYGKDGETYYNLFQAADSALYRAKRNGRGSYSFFSPEPPAEEH